MKLGLSENMHRIDQEAAENYGLPELVLMENAGHRTAEVVAEVLAGLEGRNLCVIAGSGNNGGDALSAARHLANAGARVKVFLTKDAAELKPSAATMCHVLEQMGIELHVLGSDRDWDRLHLALRFTEGVVDGILGTGFAGELRKQTLRLIEEINQAGVPVVAIDIPSGVTADTGAVASVAVRAQATLSLGLPKPGQLLSPGADYVGRLLVDDIGLPKKLLESDQLQLELLNKELAAMLLPPRPRAVHKGSCGRILLVAGSQGMTGAAAMAAEAAMRAGAGLVTLATPESVQPVLAAKLTEVMTTGLPEEEPGRIQVDKAVQKILRLSQEADVLLMGPGLGRAAETLEMVRLAASQVSCPLVLDADALYAFNQVPEALSACQQMPILTPHLGELGRLLGISVDELRASLVTIAQETAKSYQSVLVLKSECTIVAYPDGDVFFTAQGNPGMATAGAGDVLAGAIAGLMRQAQSAVAPLLGVYLHGRAGDLAYEELGEGLIAGDIIGHLPAARRELLKYQSGCSKEDANRRLFTKSIDKVTVRS